MAEKSLNWRDPVPQFPENHSQVLEISLRSAPSLCHRKSAYRRNGFIFSVLRLLRTLVTKRKVLWRSNSFPSNRQACRDVSIMMEWIFVHFPEPIEVLPGLP